MMQAHSETRADLHEQGRDPALRTDRRRATGGAIGQSRLGSFLILLAVNAVCLAVVVVALDLAFGDWFSGYVLPYGGIANRTFTYQQRLYDPPSLVTYVRDRYGLRGVHVPLDQVDVVTLGGSTTDQRFITEGETWQDVIGGETGLRIANAGVNGLSSFGHLVAITQWLHPLMKLRPRYYLHYLGVNDALYINEAQLKDPSHRHFLEQLRKLQVAAPSLGRILRERSALVRSYLRLTAWLAGPPAIAEHQGRPETFIVAQVKAEVDRAPIRDYIDQFYRPNLERLIALHRQVGERVIMVSQPVHPAVVRRDGDVVFAMPSMAFWGVALAMINDATGAACRAHAPDCSFIDLARELPVERSDFYDIVHNTPAGARRIGLYLAQKLQAMGAGPTPSSSPGLSR